MPEDGFKPFLKRDGFNANRTTHLVRLSADAHLMAPLLFGRLRARGPRHYFRLRERQSHLSQQGADLGRGQRLVAHAAPPFLR